MKSVSRVLFVAAVVFAVLMPASQASAGECEREWGYVMTYWGWYGQHGAICGETTFSPPLDPNTKQMIGQFALRCDGQYEWWGETDCADMTVEEYDCVDCDQALTAAEPNAAAANVND